MAESNPNGANQYTLDPRQALCWALYINPDSETFGNAYQSALKAGYDDQYAANIKDSNWFSDKLCRLNRVKKAESVLEDTLELDTEDPITGKQDAGLIRAKTDVAKFLLEKTSKDYQPKKEIDITTQGDKVVGITYITPKE